MTMVADTALVCPVCAQLIHMGDEVMEDEYGDAIHVDCCELLTDDGEGG